MNSNKSIRIFIFIVFNLLGSPRIFAQGFLQSVPFSIHMEPSSFTNVVELPDLNNSEIQLYVDSINLANNCINCKGNYYGKGIPASIDIKQQGELRVLEDGSKLWLLKISSQNCYGMQFYFDNFKLPYAATLYIYNEDKTMILGAYTSTNNNPDQTKHIKFGTQWISGNNILVEYHEPLNPEFNGDLSIVKVIHIFKDVFNQSQLRTGSPFEDAGSDVSCIKNIVCPEGSGWEKEINSVALILAYNESYNLTRQCSGALVNNSEQNGHPYFLTANHCIDIPNLSDPSFDYLYDYSSWVFLFNHQTSSCSGDGSSVSSSISQSVYGSTLLSSDAHNSPNSDYLLLDLNTTASTLSSYGCCYAGWDISSNHFPAFSVIHHPAGTVKKITLSGNSIVSTAYDSPVANSLGKYWKVVHSDGVTLGGSSGAPLFNNNHRIIGQLRGGNSSCVAHSFSLSGFPTQYYGPAEPDWFGKFITSYSSGNFAQWLDPNASMSGAGILAINSFCPSPLGTGGSSGGGIGGGGSGGSSGCPSGTTIKFDINSHSTIEGDIINVCNLNILISPHSSCDWAFTYLETSTDHVPCALAGAPSGNPYNCYTSTAVIPIIVLADLSCICQYNRLFISVQECDENKNLLGIEHSKWFDAPLGFSDFVLNSNLPTGASIQDGKYYKIKMATMIMGVWTEHNGFIRVYDDNLLIQNKTITHDQFATLITIEDSNVPSTADIKVVAKSKIEILPTTTLESGVYYIDNFDCNSLDQFKLMNSTNTPPYEVVTASSSENYSSSSSNNSNNLIEEKKPDQRKGNLSGSSLKIYPNPAIDEMNIEFELGFDQNVSIDLNSISSSFRKNLIVSKPFLAGTNIISFNLSDIPNGVYFVRFSSGNITETKKIIVLKD